MFVVSCCGPAVGCPCEVLVGMNSSGRGYYEDDEAPVVVQSATTTTMGISAFSERRRCHPMMGSAVEPFQDSPVRTTSLTRV